MAKKCKKNSVYYLFINLIVFLKKNREQNVIYFSFISFQTDENSENGCPPYDNNNKEVKNGETVPVEDPQNLTGKCLTLPSKLDLKNIAWNELDELLQVMHFFIFVILREVLDHYFNKINLK